MLLCRLSEDDRLTMIDCEVENGETHEMAYDWLRFVPR